MGRVKSGVVTILVILATCLLLPLIAVALAVAVVAHRPRIILGMALGLLVPSAVAMAAGWEGLAASLGVWSYCLLGVGVALMLLKVGGEREDGGT